LLGFDAGGGGGFEAEALFLVETECFDALTRFGSVCALRVFLHEINVVRRVVVERSIGPCLLVGAGGAESQHPLAGFGAMGGGFVLVHEGGVGFEGIGGEGGLPVLFFG